MILIIITKLQKKMRYTQKQFRLLLEHLNKKLGENSHKILSSRYENNVHRLEWAYKDSTRNIIRFGTPKECVDSAKLAIYEEFERREYEKLNSRN